MKQLFLYRVPIYLQPLKAQSKGSIGFGREFYMVQASSDNEAYDMLRSCVIPGDHRPLDGSHLLKKYRTTIPATHRPWLKRTIKVFRKIPMGEDFIKEVYYKVEPDGYFKVSMDLVSYKRGIYLKLIGQPTYPNGVRKQGGIIGLSIHATGTFISNHELCQVASALFGDSVILRRKEIIKQKVFEYIHLVINKIIEKQTSCLGLKKIPVLGFKISLAKKKRVSEILKRKKFYSMEIEGLMEEAKCLLSVGSDVVSWKGKKLKLKSAPKSLRKFFGCSDRLYIGII